MGLISRFFQKKNPGGVQPHAGWSWSLSVNGMPAAGFDWEDIARALDGLGPHGGSFVILEQKQGEDYWFIQSAVALAGPHTGEYIVGVGWNDSEGKHLIERYGGAGDAAEMFRAVWQGRHLDYTGFEDQSGLLPGNS